MKTVLAGAAVAVVAAGAAQAATVDLTANPSGVINGATYVFGGSPGAAGTGVFPSFVKIQGNTSSIAGVNDPDGVLDTGIPHDTLLLSSLVLTSDGLAYEFSLDLNQNNSGSIDPVTGLLDKLELLQNVELYLSPSSNPTDILSTDTQAQRQAKLGQKVYLMDEGGDNNVKIDASIFAGSGKADMLLYVPKTYFDTALANLNTDPMNPVTAANAYVYLYSSFLSNNAGGEEWGQRQGAAPPLPGAVPVPPAVWGGLILLSGMAAKRLTKSKPA